MKENDKIPTGRLQRSGSFIKAGAKVGGNYLKYYAKKVVDNKTTKDELHRNNAEDLYGSLSELKGSALKAAQMLSLDKNILPAAYSNKFAMSQYSVPPLSYPLVMRTFQKLLGKRPNQIFDTFSKNAVNAASIGQVHKATIGNKVFAVKVQYPGVAESISADLSMVKPFARRMFNVSAKEFDYYLTEIEARLLEETDYNLELQRSIEIAQQCKNAGLINIEFANYYPEYSSERILTMDWLTGKHLKEFLETNPNQEIRNKIGQALWDFYHYQIHELRQVHADPHPGNFLFKPNGTVAIIDFGCVKVIPDTYYNPYFKLLNPAVLDNAPQVTQLFYDLEFISDKDSEKEKQFFIGIFKDMSRLLGRPFHYDTFDFADPSFFDEIFKFSERISKLDDYKNSRQARGSRDGLYINRTYFGLYTLMHDLKATINTKSAKSKLKAVI